MYMLFGFHNQTWSQFNAIHSMTSIKNGAYWVYKQYVYSS